MSCIHCEAENEECPSELGKQACHMEEGDGGREGVRRKEEEELGRKGRRTRERGKDRGKIIQGKGKKERRNAIGCKVRR